MNILHLEPDSYDAKSKEIIESIGRVDYVKCRTQIEFINKLESKNYEVIFIGLGLRIDENVLNKNTQLRWIISPTTGLDHLDVDIISERNIRLISLRDEKEFLASVLTTAEHTWALLLSLVRNLFVAHKSVLQGTWRRGDYFCGELRDKTLGIIGFGRLGKIVADYGLAFGMEVLIYDKENQTLDKNNLPLIQCELNELLSKSDVVSIHLPLNDSTYGFISKKRLGLMKKGSILINTARGELLNEKALLEALVNSDLAGAGLDVLSGETYWNEKIPDSHPLIEYAKRDDNLVLTPHIGGYGKESVFLTRRFVTRKFFEKVSKSKSTV